MKLTTQMFTSSMRSTTELQLLGFKSAIAKVRYHQKSAGHMQNRKTKTNTNPSPDPNRYRRRCPNPNARIQKFIHYMAISTFAIADLCDSGLSPLLMDSSPN